MTPDPGQQDEALDLLTAHVTRTYTMLNRLIGYAESGVHPGRALLDEARALIPATFQQPRKN